GGWDWGRKVGGIDARVYQVYCPGIKKIPLPEEPMTAETATQPGADWKPTACILCECNCGILVKLGGTDGRRFEHIRGDKAHPASKGYTCQKALRLDHYQNGRGERMLRPRRRRGDGSFEEIDGDTAT